MPAYNGIAYPVASTAMGLAVESTRGTAVEPNYWIPIKAPKYKPNLTLLPDETLQGSMVQTYDLVTGIRYDGHGWNAPPYLDTFPILLLAEFGYEGAFTEATLTTTLSAPATAGSTTVTVTSATGLATGSYIVIGSSTSFPATLETHRVVSVATDTVTIAEPLIYNQPDASPVTQLQVHEYSLLNSAQPTGNQPPSITLSDFDGEEWRQISAAQLDELSIKGNGTSLVDYTCTWMGNPAVQQYGNNAGPGAGGGFPYTPSFGTGPAGNSQTPAPWTFYSVLGGTYTPTIIDWSFDFKRGVKPIPALTGEQQYFSYFAGPIQATGKFTFVEQAESPELNKFLDAQRQSFDFTLFDQQNGSALNFFGHYGQFKTGEIDRSKEYVEVMVEFDLLPSAADSLAGAGGVSPCTITVANAVNTAYMP